MARLQSQADLMHVPTPEAVLERLRLALDIPSGVRALDPCCGSGSALASLNPRGINFGIELERRRAKTAKGNLSHVLSCSMQEARVSHNAFGLLLLNPPYDSSTEGRLEGVFLDRCTRYLEPGGILVLIIKEEMYGVVTRRLMREYEPCGHWRFPDGLYDGPELGFKQTCLIARKLVRPSNLVDPAVFGRNFLNLGSLEAMPDQHSWSAYARDRVPIGRNPEIFLPGSLSEVDLAILLKNSPLAEKRMLQPPRVWCDSPPLPLKQGHISLVLASGLVNGVYGEGKLRHVAKGGVVRRNRVEWEMDETAAGEPAAIRLTTEFFTIQIRALLPDGQIVEMSTGCEREAADD